MTSFDEWARKLKAAQNPPPAAAVQRVARDIASQVQASRIPASVTSTSTGAEIRVPSRFAAQVQALAQTRMAAAGQQMVQDIVAALR